MSTTKNQNPRFPIKLSRVAAVAGVIRVPAVGSDRSWVVGYPYINEVTFDSGEWTI
jgi:hypothetical protein